MSEERRVLTNDEKLAFVQNMGGKPAKEAHVDTPKEESKTEDVQEEVQKSEVKEEPKKEDTNVQDDFLSTFNKRFEKNFESEDAFKTLFEKADGYDGLKTTHDETLQKLVEYQNLAEQLDPMSHFASEDEYIRQQFLKTKTEGLSDDVLKALSTLSPSKVKDMSSEDALRLNLMINDGLSGEEADAYLLQKYNVDEFNFDDMDIGVKAAIKVDAKNAKEKLGEMYKDIKVPEKADYETVRTQLKETWNEPINEIIKGIDKIELGDGLDFVVTDDMKEGLTDQYLSYVMSKQIKPSTEAGADLMVMAKKQIVLDNIDKVVKSIESDLREKINSEVKSEIHNDKPFNNDAKASQNSTDNESKMRRFL